MIQKIYLGAGCFWGVQYYLKRIEGVLSTAVGYSGGETKETNYREVCAGVGNHAEVVEVEYDSRIVDLNTILDIFWRVHDPTQLNRQGVDIGVQYRSIILTTSDEQLEISLKSKDDFDKSGVFPISAVTEIIPFEYFIKGEEHHQDYFDRNGGAICHAIREK